MMQDLLRELYWSKVKTSRLFLSAAAVCGLRKTTAHIYSCGLLFWEMNNKPYCITERYNCYN